MVQNIAIIGSLEDVQPAVTETSGIPIPPGASDRQIDQALNGLIEAAVNMATR